ncbi:nuclear transport factor 2 family protein [Dongia sp. agr-C8]
MSGELDLPRHLRCLEEQLLSPEGRASPRLIDDLLAEDFQEIGASGDVFGKPEAMELLAEEARDGHAYERRTSDWSVRRLAGDVQLVTYRVVRHDPTERSTVTSLRSSIWALREGRWQMVFHQGTRLR